MSFIPLFKIAILKEGEIERSHIGFDPTYATGVGVFGGQPMQVPVVVFSEYQQSRMIVVPLQMEGRTVTMEWLDS